MKGDLRNEEKVMKTRSHTYNKPDTQTLELTRQFSRFVDASVGKTGRAELFFYRFYILGQSHEDI